MEIRFGEHSMERAGKGGTVPLLPTHKIETAHAAPAFRIGVKIAPPMENECRFRIMPGVLPRMTATAAIEKTEMQWSLRIACLVYVLFLTLLLLTSEPSRWVGFRSDLPWLLRYLLPAAHLLSFFVLAVLALAARWPLPRWSILLILAIYASATEFVQSLVPSRAPEWKDWVQDLGGIVLGAAICWGIAALIGSWARSRRTRASARPADEWEIVNTVMNRPAAGEQSWWG